MSDRDQRRKMEEVRDRRRWAVDRSQSQGPAPKPDYVRAREMGERDRIETAKRLRSELGLSTTDREIESLAKKRTEEATRRAIRDNGDG